MVKIISGGQTGADIAGVDAAISKGVQYGGWIPKGRKNEKGYIHPDYTDFVECGTEDYGVRTRQNVLNSDGTVIFTDRDTLFTGSKLTYACAKRYKKPCIHVCIKNTDPFSAVDVVYDFIVRNNIKVLNVAGSRQSKCHHMHTFVYTVIIAVIDKINLR